MSRKPRSKKLILSETQISLIKELRSKKTTSKEISNILNINYEMLKKAMRRIGISTEKIKVKLNENYFEDINSSDKAYWLGFLMADGCINNKYKTTLISKDREIPEKFKIALNADIPVGMHSYLDKRTNKTYTSHTIQINRQKFVEILDKYSINKEKSYNGKFPDIPEIYYKDYIRGLFDGDGSLCKRYNKTWLIKLIGTLNIINFIQTLLINKFGCSKVKISIVCDNHKAKQYALCINRTVDIKSFLDFIYLESNEQMRLNRKYDLYQQFLSEYDAILKNRELNKHKKRPERWKKIIRNDGFVYESITDAAKYLKVSQTSISHALKKNFKIKGFTFKYYI